MLGLRKLRSIAHQYVHKLMYRGLGPVTRKQRLAASVTSRPVPSVSRSVGTPTRGADVQKHVSPARSSPQKKDKTSNKPSSPKVSPVHESDAYSLLLKLIKGKVRRDPL